MSSEAEDLSISRYDGVNIPVFCRCMFAMGMAWTYFTVDIKTQMDKGLDSMGKQLFRAAINSAPTAKECGGHGVEFDQSMGNVTCWYSMQNGSS